MKILSSSQIRQADEYTIQHEPIQSHLLMERAAKGIYHWIINRFSNKHRFEIICGSGNNGGDGLALACMLFGANYPIKIHYLEGQIFSPDAQFYLNQANDLNVRIDIISQEQTKLNLDPDAIIIDAIFGTGLNRPVEGPYAEMINIMNDSGQSIISIDLPSGLMSEDNSNNLPNRIIKANYTLTFELPKLAFLFPENAGHVGIWEVISIGLHSQYLANLSSPFQITEPEDLRFFLKGRKKFDHKGKFGHSFLIAGGYGKIGAAILAGKACLRAGTGLLTIHVPRLGYEVVQTSLPEAMVSIDSYDKLISKIPSIELYTAVGIGPGIGKTGPTMQALRSLLLRSSNPLVIDADAINIIAENRELIDLIPKNSIITPHLKEFERLLGPANNHYNRLMKQIEFATQHQVIVILKGAYTSVVDTDGNCYFNPSGNPGMATGGSGDVLTGMILSFLAQGYSPIQAARLGVYLHGRAGDLVCDHIEPECMLASDIIDCIGKAFKELKEIGSI